MNDGQRRLLDVALRKLMDILKDDPDFMRDDESKACFVALVTVDSAIKNGQLNALAEVCGEFCKLQEASFNPWGITDARPDKRF